MLVIGDVSGIQDYVFDVAHAGGGQARRLRARSFFVQILSECAARRVLRKLNWEGKHLLLCGAGKFVLEGPGHDSAVIPDLEEERRAIEEWLISHTGGALRFSLAVSEGEGPEAYRIGLKHLTREKLRPWAQLSVTGGRWVSEKLVLDPLGKPCDVCRRAPAVIDERDADTGETRQVCRACHNDVEIGRKLPGARWLVVRELPGEHDFDVLGLGVNLYEHSFDGSDGAVIAIASLAEAQQWPASLPESKRIDRPLARHVPTEDGLPIEFEALSLKSRGDPLLAVLKMDVDSLGKAFDHERRISKDMQSSAKFGKEIDQFFAADLQREMSGEPYCSLYTIFSGGDDLLLVGPWDIVLDFAGKVHDLFAARFRDRDLTISAGISLFKRKRPIRNAVHDAEQQLEAAKHDKSPGADDAKDQCAALGQMWKWKDHDLIIGRAKQLAAWVESGAVERGWLHTLLSFSLSRETSDAPVHARLARHVARNYPKPDDRDSNKASFRKWANELVDEFGSPNRPETIYLPTILRYAITASRKEE